QWNEAFSLKKADALSTLLTTIALPDVSHAEQMQLLAVVDTFRQMQETSAALDSCGQKFALEVKINAFMKRSRHQAAGLSSRNWAWAFHSDAQETLLGLCLPQQPLWADVKSAGLAIWLRNPTIVRSLAEKIAKNQFMA